MCNIVSIHQPQYFPWAGYIQKILASDLFIYLDHVQFSKNGFQNRNQLKSPEGALWFSVPVRHNFGQKITEVQIAEPTWGKKHASYLAMNYAKSPGYQRWKPELDAFFLNRGYSSMGELAIASTEWILSKLNARGKRVRSSELGEINEKKSALVAKLCAKCEGTVYLTGSGSLEYMIREDFDRIGCDVWLQKSRSFTYSQQFPKTDFIPNLSVLDLLLNIPDEAAELLNKHCDWRVLWKKEDEKS